ncbi:MraY family glycosyltransferase [Thiocystis violacea]|uniref:MraY family glycosyltransferase n=1 Tax=Thiocystis violacea TaxID=13725 RepID=UPI00190404CF|nr:glycosyltransferase family 4 protein [Thiocystis violacea]MBK1722097.1 glycosyl transferase [Thiocystis violacea]
MTAEQLLFGALPLVAFALSLTTTRWLVSHRGARLGRLDQPNARSLHSTPVPRTGGLGVLTGIVTTLCLAGAMGAVPPELGWIAAAVAAVAAVSFVDDLGHLPPLVRLMVHLLAAILLVIGGVFEDFIDLPGLTLVVPGAALGLLVVLFVVWMINLYNFMDGMDGFAGGMAVIGFSSLALLGWRAEDPSYAVAALCVACAAGGFLIFNLPPARIFLGDIGSSSLGLLAAGFALWGAQRDLFPLWVAGLIFSPFIVDATWTLLARLVRGERIWEPHRSHHYQRLVLAGWSHRKTLLRGYLVMAAVAACAIAAPGLSVRDQWMLLGAWTIIYLTIHFQVMLVEREAAVH